MCMERESSLIGMGLSVRMNHIEPPHLARLSLLNKTTTIINGSISELIQQKKGLIGLPFNNRCSLTFAQGWLSVCWTSPTFSLIIYCWGCFKSCRCYKAVLINHLALIYIWSLSDFFQCTEGEKTVCCAIKKKIKSEIYFPHSTTTMSTQKSLVKKHIVD